MDKQACEAEKAAANGDLNTVYKVTKQLTEQNNTCTKPVKDKEGKVITTERKQAARWVQHFKEVLNRSEPNKSGNPDPSDDLNTNTIPPS